MSEVKIIGPAVPNVPWQEKPAEFMGAPVWRYNENPIIGRNPVKEVARIFNSAVTVSYTHLTLPTIGSRCISRWSPYH